MHRVKSFDVMSVAKISGLCYGALGVCFIPLFLLIGVLGSVAGRQTGGPGQAFGAFFGVGMAIFMPIAYACMGFVMGALGAFIYNLISGWVGGIEVELVTVTPVQLIQQPTS
jgi:hypothetical protein